MASTFKFFNDSGCTSAYSGVFTIAAKADFSDGDHDLHLYFGSASLVDSALTADSSPGIDPIVLSPTYLIQEWVVATVYSVGDNIIPTTPNGFRYVCTIAGTSDATTEPTWGIGLGSITADNGTLRWETIAPQRDVSEITLALSEADLDTNTPGDSLSLGTATLLSGAVNAISVWIRVINSLTTTSSTIGKPEIGIGINNCSEDTV